MELSERIRRHTDRTLSCWLWTGALDTNGYGQLGITGKSRKPAHKVIYELNLGEVPIGMELDHLCRVRKCVNPGHLEPVSQYENNRRGFSPPSVNGKKTHCAKGHEFSEENTYK